MNPDIRLKITKGTKTLVRVAAFVGAITVIAGGYTFYLNNIWKPDVKVLLVDFTKGYAEILFEGKKLILEGDAIVLLDGDWGIKFGTVLEENESIYKSIILTKKGRKNENHWFFLPDSPSCAIPD
jgi:hypothetical protein